MTDRLSVDRICGVCARAPVIRVLYVAGGRLFCGRSWFGVDDAGMHPRCLECASAVFHELGQRVSDEFR